MALPQVLAGPIVRRVVGNEVAVWMALRDSATVELVVWAGPQRSTGAGSIESGTPPVARGTAQTKRLGAQLHVAVVVAEATAIIAPGAIHSYDVIVGGQGLGELGLLRDEAATPLGVLLNEGGHRLRLAEAEVARDGAVVTRRYQLARTPDGGTALWIGRRKRVGDGEGWSGLRFDIALPPSSA